mgnify:CR=1 FL=1
MTDIMKLAEALFTRIEWQSVNDPVTIEDMAGYIMEAIKTLYVMTGRAMLFSDELIIKTEELYIFKETLPLDEQEYVLVTAQVDFLRKVQTSVDNLTSYTTDALSVSHGDKPYANLKNTIAELESKRRTIWYKMTRYHLL